MPYQILKNNITPLTTLALIVVFYSTCKITLACRLQTPFPTSVLCPVALAAITRDMSDLASDMLVVSSRILENNGSLPYPGKLCP